MTFQPVRELMPEADWSIRTDQGCVWKYATKLQASNSLEGKAMSVGFGDNSLVREIGSGGNLWETVRH